MTSETSQPKIENIQQVLVIGAGTMGRQIAMSAALAGYLTTIQDLSADMRAAARTALAQWVAARVAGGKLHQAPADAALGRLAQTTELETAAVTADFVIEAATERIDVKTRI